MHLSSQPCVLSSQNGLHIGGGEEHSVQPLQPPQVHLSPQPCVLSSQNGLHTAGGDGGGGVGGGGVGGGADGGEVRHSEQPLQPPQVHLSSQSCVLSSQNGLHIGGGEEHSVQPLQPPQVHLSSQPCVLSSQNGLHSGSGTMHSVQPLQPTQVHLLSQACVLSSQNGLHTGAEHSVQPAQPPQVHLSSQACVLSSQNGLHTEDVACTQTASASDITARTCDVCTSVSVSEEYLDDILDASKIRGGAARSGPTHSAHPPPVRAPRPGRERERGGTLWDGNRTSTSLWSGPDGVGRGGAAAGDRPLLLML